MARVPFDETPEFKMGQAGEQVVVAELKARGFFIIPSYDFCGQNRDKAPKLKGSKQSFVLPDIDVSNSAIRLWIEVKTKTKATLYRNWQRLEHGIPLRHYEDYKEVERITGAEVWLFVYETSTKEIRYRRLADLEPCKREYRGGEMSRGGMVFWARDWFQLLSRKT